MNRNNYYGLPGNYLRTYADIGTVKVEHDVNSRLTLRNQSRYANYSRAVMTTEARLSGNAKVNTPSRQSMIRSTPMAFPLTVPIFMPAAMAGGPGRTGRLQRAVASSEFISAKQGKTGVELCLPQLERGRPYRFKRTLYARAIARR